MKCQNPVVMVPGITATTLVDDYPLKTDELWSMLFNRDYERIALHPDDLRYEAIEPAHVVPQQLFPIYNDLVKALRFELSTRADRPTPVFAFPYDWRMDISNSATRLGKFIDEVIARTNLLRHYRNSDVVNVDIVGHSMGGLLICEYLSQQRGRSKVGKVITLGTPYTGSVEAIVKISTGMSLLTGGEPKEREREAARLTPSIYQLLPSFEGAVVHESGDAVDIFNPKNMQASVLNSLSEFVRLYSVKTRAADREKRAGEILADMLANARKQRNSVESFKTSDGKIKRTDWLAIVGVGEKTRVQMTVTNRKDGPRFVIAEDQFVNDFRKGKERTGDGTVPFAGAMPPFLPKSQIVCVTSDDLGTFEIRDRLLVEFGGLHGLLPRINLVQRLIARHLRADYRGDVWGRRSPGSTSWNPPILNLPEKPY